MNSEDRLYKISDAGKSFASNPSPSRRDPVLDYLYSCKGQSVTVSEAAGAVGWEETIVADKLRQFKKRGLVKEIA